MKFSLVHPDQTISEISFDQLLQQSPKTLLYFYPKNDTPWCTVEAVDFSERIQAFTDTWVQVVWVSRDSATSHCGFIGKHDLKPYYLSDPDLILHKQFQAYGEKNNYGKIVTGVIRSTILLDQSWAIVQERHNVRAKWHAERILKEVSE
jgi:peroxiredoxin Q/BCP